MGDKMAMVMKSLFWLMTVITLLCAEDITITLLPDNNAFIQ